MKAGKNLDYDYHTVVVQVEHTFWIILLSFVELFSVNRKTEQFLWNGFFRLTDIENLANLRSLKQIFSTNFFFFFFQFQSRRISFLII